MRRLLALTAVTATLALLAGCGGSPARPTPTPTSSVSALTPTPSGTPAPTQTPAPSATATAPATATPVAAQPCQLWPIRGGAAGPTSIVDVRVGVAEGRERIVIEFDRVIAPYEMKPNPAGSGSIHFTGTFSGLPIDVAGGYGVLLQLTGLEIPNAYPHGNDLRPMATVLKQIRLLGDFEGAADFAIGLSRNACPTITELSGPARLVIDFAPE